MRENKNHMPIVKEIKVCVLHQNKLVATKVLSTWLNEPSIIDPVDYTVMCT